MTHAETGTTLTFERLDAWRKARAIVKRVYGLTRTAGLAHDFGLSGQIRRAGVSVMSNIAEGFERAHLQEKLQFYNVARGSTAEVRSLLYVIEDNYPELQQDVEALRGDIVAAGQLLSGLIRSTQRRRGLNWLACALPILIAILLL